MLHTGIQSEFCSDRPAELLPDHNIQNPAIPFLTAFRMIYDARAVHARQCKLNEPLSWARYFHECYSGFTAARAR